MTDVRARLERRGGIPVVLLGLGYVGYGLAYGLRLESPLPIDWAVVVLYELLALAVVLGGVGLSRRDPSLSTALRVSGATVGFGAIGLLVAAALIGLELSRGVPIVDVPFLMAAASVTTAAIGVVLAVYDVDLRAERANLAAQAATVSELNKRLTVLHRVLRHNLRNELNVIQGRAELLLDESPDPATERSLRTLLDHAANVRSLSENAYRLRQVWADDARVEQEVTELVEDCVRELEAAYPAVSVTTDLPAHAVVRAHPRLELAVAEALENAAVHNEASTVDVIVDVSRIEGEEPSVAISIADTGTGIPDLEPDALGQVEERPLDHATGLGLWLIYWVVEESGGWVRFESNEPHGTIVHLRLPAAD